MSTEQSTVRITTAYGTIYEMQGKECEPMEATDTKKPQVGEWWQQLAIGMICNIHHVDRNGSLYIVFADGTARQIEDCPFLKAFIYLPDCTGYDWVPEDWVEITDLKHVIRDRFDWCKLNSSTEWVKATSVRHGSRVIGEWGINWEFRCRRKDLPVKTVESPEDWVEITDPEHVVRSGIDFVNTSHSDPDAWYTVPNIEHETISEWAWGKFRCRRKDLPVKTDLCVMCGKSPVIPGTAGCQDCTQFSHESVGIPPTEEPKPVRLEVGKRYVNRKGEIRGPIEQLYHYVSHPYADSNRTYTSDGLYTLKRISDWDLVAEYIEPPATRQKVRLWVPLRALSEPDRDFPVRCGEQITDVATWVEIKSDWTGEFFVVE